MANPFFNYDGAFIPGTLARAESVANEFLAVQAGFSLLSYAGTDSGTAGAYIITTLGAPTGAYSNAQIVQFQALNGNAGASTIAVNGLTTVPLTRFDGTPLQAGDVIAGVFYTAQYDAAGMKFRITSPAAYTTSTSTVSGSAPTHKVGLVASGGVSTAVVPIDATYAIDQAISPTWTSPHTFSPASGNPITINSTVGNAGVRINGASNDPGSLALVDGNTGNRIWRLRSGGASTGTFDIFDATGGASRLQVSTTGNVVVNAPSSGVALSVTAVSAALALSLVGASGDASRIGLTDGNAGNRVWQVRVGGAATGTFDLFDATAVASRVQINSTGNVVVNAPTSGTTIAATSVAAGEGFKSIGAASNPGRISVVDGNTGNRIWQLRSGGVATGTFDIFDNTGSASRVQINTSGNVVVNAPASGTALAVTAVSTALAMSAVGATNDAARIGLTDGNTGNRVYQLRSGGAATGTFDLFDSTSSASRIQVNSSGAVAINAPSAGFALTVNGKANANSMFVQGSATASQSFGLVVAAGTNSSDLGFEVFDTTAGTQYFLVRGDGLVKAVDQGGTLQDVGWRGTPANFQNGTTYTLQLSDRGKTVVLGSASGGTVTVPANVFASGDVVTLLAFNGTNTWTVARGVGLSAMYWAGAGVTNADRTIASVSYATILFEDAVNAVISGPGLS